MTTAHYFLLSITLISIATYLINKNEETIRKWNRTSCKENWLALSGLCFGCALYSLHLSYSEDNLKYFLHTFLFTVGMTTCFRVSEDEDWLKNK